MFLRPLRRQRLQSIERLYGAIVAQARRPAFYTALAVPDTLEGRFDLIVLHVHLVFRRLSGAGTEALAVGQGVFDWFVGDMDSSLREIGVGDLAVPKRMRAMGEAFYGRAGAYDAALKAEDDDELSAALLRNVYSGDGQTRGHARALARYVRQVAASLAAQDANAIARGDVGFPVPAED